MDKILKYFNLLMLLLYLVLGIFLLVYPVKEDYLNKSQRLILGILFILYFIFRAYKHKLKYR
jgi:hypothetical protein